LIFKCLHFFLEVFDFRHRFSFHGSTSDWFIAQPLNVPGRTHSECLSAVANGPPRLRRAFLAIHSDGLFCLYLDPPLPTFSASSLPYLPPELSEVLCPYPLMHFTLMVVK
jgi:hypothetical protein